MIRCGYRGASDGTFYKDSMFETNVEGALAAGLEVGVYVYSQAITTSEAKAEANLALQMCEGYSITLPIVLYYEYYTATTGRLATASLTKTQRTNICLAFCNTVDAAGYGAMVYANKSITIQYRHVPPSMGRPFMAAMTRLVFRFIISRPHNSAMRTAPSPALQ